MNFIAELRWRGLLFDSTPDAEKNLNESPKVGYIGFDPTASSLTIGNLVPIIILMHWQRYGHQAIALVGGATGMIGDPSGKKSEREFLTPQQLNVNQLSITKQLNHFLQFDAHKNPAILLNNFDWFNNMSVLDFLREAGKHLTISYMLAKDSVQSRLDGGLSFTEFSYQLIQGWDFYHLNKNHNCTFQLGGQDQWGNMTAGLELIRRKGGSTDANVITFPLISKADGTKFGKSESGAIWLDANLTSPFEFYQFWLRQSDTDAARYIKIFTFLSQEEIETLIETHTQNPHLRALQLKLAAELTTLVHSEQALVLAIEQTNKTYNADFTIFTDDDFENFGSQLFDIERSIIEKSIDIVSLLGGGIVPIYSSKGEARREIQAGAVKINNEKIADSDTILNISHAINNKYLVVQKGKKNKFVIRLN
jgi:tyrosyl-tRNA synthetase